MRKESIGEVQVVSSKVERRHHDEATLLLQAIGDCNNFINNRVRKFNLIVCLWHCGFQKVKATVDAVCSPHLIQFDQPHHFFAYWIMALCAKCRLLPVEYECPHCGVGHCDYCRVKCDSCDTLYCEECIELCFSCPGQRKQICKECRVVCACHNAAFCRICDKTFRCAHCDKLWCRLFSNDKHEAEHYRRFVATYFVMGLRCNGTVTESVSHALKSQSQ